MQHELQNQPDRLLELKVERVTHERVGTSKKGRQHDNSSSRIVQHVHPDMTITSYREGDALKTCISQSWTGL